MTLWKKKQKSTADWFGAKQWHNHFAWLPVVNPSDGRVHWGRVQRQYMGSVNNWLNNDKWWRYRERTD